MKSIQRWMSSRRRDQNWNQWILCKNLQTCVHIMITQKHTCITVDHCKHWIRCIPVISHTYIFERKTMSYYQWKLNPLKSYESHRPGHTLMQRALTCTGVQTHSHTDVYIQTNLIYINIHRQIFTHTFI